MNRQEIMEMIPHRDHMLLLDDAELIDGESVAHYHVTGDEFFLKGHFPGNPIVPGVILCEILAQSACVLMKEGLKEGKLPVYTGLNNVRFRAPVRPGDRVTARCHVTRSRGRFYFCSGTIKVEDRLCVSADFSFAITGGV